jgi:dipeptidase
VGKLKDILRILFRYFDADYGVMNEYGVGISESTCSAKIGSIACKYVGQREREKNCALLSINELSKIALERTQSAREAVKLIGELATYYGFYGPEEAEFRGESLKVIDKNEGFELEILASDKDGKSAIWVA